MSLGSSHVEGDIGIFGWLLFDHCWRMNRHDEGRELRSLKKPLAKNADFSVGNSFRLPSRLRLNSNIGTDLNSVPMSHSRFKICQVSCSNQALRLPQPHQIHTLEILHFAAIHVSDFIAYPIEPLNGEVSGCTTNRVCKLISIPGSFQIPIITNCLWTGISFRQTTGPKGNGYGA